LDITGADPMPATTRQARAPTRWRSTELAIALQLAPPRATILVSGKFDFAVHREFRTRSEQALGEAGVSEIVVDLSQATYLDSAALGMLLLTKERGASVSKRIALRSVPGTVQDVLKVANFDKLFPAA
jgi:HptB-dependent secretion and biofilm anti anti-sigma factor